MKQYHDLMTRILESGITKADRTGTGTKSVFGHQMRFNLQEGFPLVTTKRVFWRGVVEELLWILSGSTNNNDLEAKGVTIWREWARPDGDLGPVYGAMWRAWPMCSQDDVCSASIQTIDQIAQVINQLSTNPDSRRMIVSAWNPAEVDKMALPPCHMMFQFYTRPISSRERLSILIDMGGDFVTDELFVGQPEEHRHRMLDEAGAPRRFLDCQLYQRSCDVFLGVPFNIASYALLTHLMAREVGMAAGEFVWTGGDTHLYLNHLEQARLQLSRNPLPLPTLGFSDRSFSIFDATFEDIQLHGYTPHGAIAAPVSV